MLCVMRINRLPFARKLHLTCSTNRRRKIKKKIKNLGEIGGEERKKAHCKQWA